jgi:hypothetical protein
LAVEGGLIVLLGLGELLEERLRRVKFEGERGLADGDCSGFLTHLLSLEVAFKGVQKETVMRHAVPVEDFLLLLRANAVVLVEEVQKRALRLLQRSIGSRFQVAEVREDTLLEFLRILHRSAKGLETEGQATDDVGTRDVEEVVPI